MSSYSNKYQSKAVCIRSSVPILSKTPKTAHIKPGRFSNYHQISKFGSSSNREESFAFYLYNYVFQDYPDDSNTVFYDSNLQKYRTRSSVRTHSNKETNKYYNNLPNYKPSKKDSYYSVSSSVLAKESAFYPNKPINILGLKRKEKAEKEYVNEGLYINNMNVKKDNEEREEIFRQLEKEKNELLASSNYSRRLDQEQDINANTENIDYNQFQNDNSNIKNNINFTNKSLQKSVKNKNVIDLEGDNFEQNQNKKTNIQITGKSPNKKIVQKMSGSAKENIISSSPQKEQKGQIKMINQKIVSSKTEETSSFQENKKNTQKSQTKKEIQKLDNSQQNVASPFLQNNQNTQKSPSKNTNLSSNKQSKNVAKVKSQNELSQFKKSPSKNANKRIEDFQSNSIPSSQNNEDINLNKNNFIQKDEKQNLGMAQDKNMSKLSKFLNQPIPQSLQNNPYQREMSSQNKVNMNCNEELNRLSNISVVKKHEERTIVLVPGQTLDPTSKSEALENPIEETIQNPDGTTTSVIKQTKIITTTENVPIEEHKIISIEGAPELPLIKQYITYEYKTVTAVKENNKEVQGFDGQNKLRNSNYGNKGTSREYIQQGFEQYGSQSYDNQRFGQNGNKGYDKQGLSQNGKKRNIPQGYDQYGNEVYDQTGYDQYGNKGYGQQGYNQYGNEGYDQTGYDQYGNEGYRQQGQGQNGNDVYAQYGYGGYDQQGLGKSGKKINSSKGYSQQGLSQSGKKLNTSPQQGISQSGKKAIFPQEYGKQRLSQSGKKANAAQKYGKQELSQSGKKSKEPQGFNQYGNKVSDNKANAQQAYNQYGNEETSQFGINLVRMKGIKENKNKGSKMPEDNQRNINNNLNDNSKDIIYQKERNIKGKAGRYVNQNEKVQYKDKNLKENKQSNFSPDILPKEFKTGAEFESFLDQINQKGEKATPEEKQKRIKCFSDIFNNISKGGINSDENLQKLSELLCNMNENDKNEILSKIRKDFPKNGELLKKLENLVKKVKSNKNPNAFKEKGKLGDFKLFGSEKKEVKSKRNEFLMKSVGESGYNKGISKEGIGIKSNDIISTEIVEVKDVNPLKFDGLFLEITKYNNEHREKNPFEGPSPYIKFYKERKIKIKNKITNMASGEVNYQNEEIQIEDVKENKE